MTPRWQHVNGMLDVCYVRTGEAPISVTRHPVHGWRLHIGVTSSKAGRSQVDAQIIVPVEGNLRFELGHALIASDATVDEEVGQ